MREHIGLTPSDVTSLCRVPSVSAIVSCFRFYSFVSLSGPLCVSYCLLLPFLQLCVFVRIPLCQLLSLVSVSIALCLCQDPSVSAVVSCFRFYSFMSLSGPFCVSCCLLLPFLWFCVFSFVSLSGLLCVSCCLLLLSLWLCVFVRPSLCQLLSLASVSVAFVSLALRLCQDPSVSAVVSCFRFCSFVFLALSLSEPLCVSCCLLLPFLQLCVFVRTPLCLLLSPASVSVAVIRRPVSRLSANGHITGKAPVLVRSPKLSTVGPGQYLDW